MGNIEEAIKKYFKTLESIGYINSKETYKILVMMFLKDFVDKKFVEDTEIVVKITDVIECVTKNSCLFPPSFECITVNNSTIVSDGFTYTFNFNLS